MGTIRELINGIGGIRTWSSNWFRKRFRLWFLHQRFGGESDAGGIESESWGDQRQWSWKNKNTLIAQTIWYRKLTE